MKKSLYRREIEDADERRRINAELADVRGWLNAPTPRQEPPHGADTDDTRHLRPAPPSTTHEQD